MSNTRKATASEVVDDDAPEAKSPVQAEAEGDEMVTVAFHGEDFTIPRDPDKWSFEARCAIDDNSKQTVILRELIGPEQSARLRAIRVDGRGLTMEELAPLFTDIAASLGFSSMGNS